MALSGWFVLKKKKGGGMEGWKEVMEEDWGNFLELVRLKSFGSHVSSHTEEQAFLYLISELKHDV